MDETLPSKIGKYPVTREIGRGGTSRVYLGRNPFANRDVAIKLVRAAEGVDPDLRRRFHKVFLNEASLVGKLIHPHIMAIYDADVSDDCFGEILYFEETKAKRVTTISSISPLVVIEIKAAALQKASDACQKQFNQAFLRILIDRLSAASDRLSTRS